MLAQRATSVRPVVAAKPAARRIRGASRLRCVATTDAATTGVPAGALELAHRLADVAGEITSQYFRWVTPCPLASVAPHRVKLYARLRSGVYPPPNSRP